MSTLKLNLGCGGQLVHGWLNIDREIDKSNLWGFQSIEYAEFDLRDPWPYEDGDAECGVMHHVLDLMSAPDQLTVLREAKRVISGPLRISSFDPVLVADRLPVADLEWWLTQDGARLSLLSMPILDVLCAVAGWKKPERSYFRDPLSNISWFDTRAGESFYVEAQG